MRSWNEKFVDSVTFGVPSWMGFLLSVTLVSPWELVTVFRVADLLTVVPLEVSVHAVKTLELKKSSKNQNFENKTYKTHAFGLTTGALIRSVDELTDSNTEPGYKVICSFAGISCLIVILVEPFCP